MLDLRDFYHSERSSDESRGGPSTFMSDIRFVCSLVVRNFNDNGDGDNIYLCSMQLHTTHVWPEEVHSMSGCEGQVNSEGEWSQVQKEREMIGEGHNKAR